MLRIMAETNVGHLDVTCEACGEKVELSNLRMVVGVPQIEAQCPTCDDRGDFNLHLKSWLDVVLDELAGSFRR